MIVKDSLDHALTGPMAAGIGHYETAMHHRAEHAARGSRGLREKANARVLPLVDRVLDEQHPSDRSSTAPRAELQA